MVIWCFVFFFKQKTAYEMRISDWSSDVCSSDLLQPARRAPRDLRHRAPAHHPARAQAVAGGGRELPGAAREARVPGFEASGQSRVNSLPPLQGEGWGGDGFPQRRGDLQANPSTPKSSH